MAKSLPLFHSNDSSDSEVEFKINKDYADKYDSWRHKEEMQKLKDLSKDISETSSSESEEEVKPEFDLEFLRALSLLQSRDPRIYDKNFQLFKEEDSQKKLKVKKEKPMFMKDYERKIVLERGGKFSDEDEDEVPPSKPSENKELDEIQKSLKAAIDSDDEEGAEVGGLFQVRNKTKQEEKEEEEDYILFLKGQKKHLDKDTEKDLTFLRNYWNDPNLNEGEKFLRDFILNKWYVTKDEEKPSYQEMMEESKALEEDEKVLREQEEFEHKFNFRFEEPDPEFIKRYPRTMSNSLRRTDNRRKMKREEYAERKKKEKEQMREELKRLKALKRKEIEEKFFKLKEASGKEEINFNEDEIESDFDPDKHDEKMKELFDDDYYTVKEQQKPEFLHDEEIDNEDWDHWTRDQAHLKAGNSSSQPDDEEDSIGEEDQAPDPKAEFEQEMIEKSAGRKKGRKKSLFAKLISKPKPLYDPDGKSFEDYLDEYYNLDYEDVIGDLPVRYKYRKVIPNDFGLSAEEILTANDKELNRWCSVKKTCQYRRDDEEIYDVQAFKKKAQNTFAKKKILASIYAPPEEEKEDASKANDAVESPGNAKRKRNRSRKKKKFQSGNDEQSSSPVEDDVNRGTFTHEGDAVEESVDLNSRQDSVSKKKKKKRNTELAESLDASQNDTINNITACENSLISSEGNFKYIDSINVVDGSKKKKKNKTPELSEAHNAFSNITASENSFLGSEGNAEGINSSNAVDGVERKKKRNKELTEEAHNATQDSSFSNISASKNSFISSKANMECVDSGNVVDGCERKKKKKKKNKRKAESSDGLLPNSSELPKTKKMKFSTTNDEKNSSINTQEFSERPGQSNSKSKKSKKRNRNKSVGQTTQMASHGDKRLAVLDSRLAAFGINPKKYKAGIFYSKK